MKKGYEGLAISLSMLLAALAIIGILKLLF
jgi:hypothetical protein